MRTASISRRAHVFGVLALATAMEVSACTDYGTQPRASAIPSARPEATLADASPPGTKHDWSTMSTDSLWAYITRGDTSVVVELTAPGLRRGVVHGKVVLPKFEWAEAARIVRSQPGLMVVDSSDLRPELRIKVVGVQALERLRHLSQVAFVEPTYLFNPPGVPISAELGCGGESWTEDIRRYTVLRPDAPYNDVVPTNYDYMSIADAWRRSPGGAGITVGLIDTGLDAYQPNLVNYFSTGSSGGRSLWVEATKWFSGSPAWQDGCAHGTHMAGTIAAPLDGRGIVGVAWAANLVTVRHHDDVVNGYSFGNDTWESARAIDVAADKYGARVITMAWGVVDENSGVITNAIQYWYNQERLFIGAAGTSQWWVPTKRVVFPASLPEVMAVTGVYPASGAWWVGEENHHGPEVELAAVVRMPTEANLYKGESGFGRTDNSSNATAIISGIAALTWAYYPWMTRDQLRQQLRSAGTGGAEVDGKGIGSGVVNAHKALGGMYSATISGPLKIIPPSGYEPITERYYMNTAGGSGPFQYHWYNGGKTTPYVDVTFYPQQNAYDAQVSGYVRDLSDGTTIFNSFMVRVEPPIDDRNGCPTCMK